MVPAQFDTACDLNLLFLCFTDAERIYMGFVYPAFLTDYGRRLIEVDDFIAKLWEIHLAVKGEGYVQVISPLV